MMSLASQPRPPPTPPSICRPVRRPPDVTVMGLETASRGSRALSATPDPPRLRSSGKTLPVAVLEQRDQILPRRAQRLSQLRRTILALFGHRRLEAIEHRAQSLRGVEPARLDLHHGLGSLEKPENAHRPLSVPLRQLGGRRRLRAGAGQIAQSRFGQLVFKA